MQQHTRVLPLAYVAVVIPICDHAPFLLLHLLDPRLAQLEPDARLELHVLLRGEDEERPGRGRWLPFEDAPHTPRDLIRTSHVGPAEQEMGAGIMR